MSPNHCPLCGNYTMRGYNVMCDCCSAVAALPARPRHTPERILLVTALLLAVAFVLIITSGHVRAQSMMTCETNGHCNCSLGPGGGILCSSGVIDLPSVGSGSAGTSAISQIVQTMTATLVIRSRDKKLVLIRSISDMERCQTIAAGLIVSPDIEFAECFR